MLRSRMILFGVLSSELIVFPETVVDDANTGGQCVGMPTHENRELRWDRSEYRP